MMQSYEHRFKIQKILPTFAKRIIMDTAKRKAQSVTSQFKVVFKSTLNDQNTLFGGIAMQWMDEVAYITATRFTRKRMVTVSTSNIRFTKPIPFGTIAEITGRVTDIGNVKLEITVEIYTEQMYKNVRDKAVEAKFYFSAINTNNRPERLV